MKYYDVCKSTNFKKSIILFRDHINFKQIRKININMTLKYYFLHLKILIKNSHLKITIRFCIIILFIDVFAYGTLCSVRALYIGFYRINKS